jgi:hypothetical protein
MAAAAHSCPCVAQVPAVFAYFIFWHTAPRHS